MPDGECDFIGASSEAYDEIATSTYFPAPTLSRPADGTTDLTSQESVGLYDPNLDLDGKDRLIVFIHGYRMLPWERRSFAETALKRLYWSGYGGKMLLFSWPTTYTSGAGQIVRPQIYDRSEMQARRSGDYILSGLLPSLQSRFQITPDNIIVMCHSMGNMVASEGFRAQTENVAGKFISLQSAELGGAYKVNAP